MDGSHGDNADDVNQEINHDVYQNQLDCLNIPPTHVGPLLHMRGGYTDTYISQRNNKVFKYCSKYYHDEEGKTEETAPIVHYSTICDLVFSKALGELNGFPTIHSFSHDPHKVLVEMSYNGKTLHDVIHRHSKAMRWSSAGKLIDQLAQYCLNLLMNGIQHTDLKPGNVLLDGDSDFHLIDFNCMSLSVPCAFGPSKLYRRKWACSIGSWQYLSPEILWTSLPQDNSMVWSIGMVVLHYLLGEHPISDARMFKYIKKVAVTRDEWRKMMTKMRRKYPSSLQLEKKFTDSLDGWWPKLQPLLEWNPHNRWSLETLLRVFHVEDPIVVNAIRVRHIMKWSDPSFIPRSVREHVVNEGYQFLVSIKQEHTFPGTIHMFDSCYKLHQSSQSVFATDINLLFLCCWALQAYLYNVFLFDNDAIIFAIYQQYAISCDVIMSHIWEVGQNYKYACWQRDWSSYVVDKTKGCAVWPLDWMALKGIILARESPYTMETLADEYIANKLLTLTLSE